MTMIDRALALAAIVHRDQRRKGTDVPYIVHPAAVALILQRHGCAEAVVIAGILHDVVEDAGISLDQIRREFGDQVADIVAAVSERKRAADGSVRSWEERKQEGLALLQRAGAEAALVKAADTIHNIRSISADLEQFGPDVWARFKRGPESQRWLYRQTLEVCRAILHDHLIVQEFENELQRLERIAAPTPASPDEEASSSGDAA